MRLVICLLVCLAALVVAEVADASHVGAQTARTHAQKVPVDTPGTEANIPNAKRAALQVLTPQQIVSAYGINGWSSSYGTGKTIGIIDAYDAPTAESDLATFNNQWGLPACTTANGCFRKLSQTGTTTYPARDTKSNWEFESVMDIQAAHAMAPGAKIILIVCNSNSNADLFAGVARAISLGANVISMSWGGTEQSGSQSFDSYFSNANIGYFASTGDNGAAGGIEYPSSSSKVIAVGGTGLLTNSGTFSSEQAWSGGGGGCSAFTTAIPAQSSISNAVGCGGRKALPDASLLSDPNSGMYVYFSGFENGAAACSPPSCWWGGGGTSLGAPLLAARAAARGILSNPALVYTGGLSFRDITTGSNGNAATAGFDKATGVGALLG